MTLDEIITRAKAGIVQGGTDPMWTADDWLEQTLDAIDMIAAAIVTANLPYYLSNDQEVTLTDGVYPLPEGTRSVRRVSVTADGLEIFPHNETEEEEITGFEIVNDSIRLMHWDGDSPASLTVDLRMFPDDDLTGDETPAKPLHGKRGGRIIAKVVTSFAKIKDESVTQEELEKIKIIIDNFVDRLGTMLDNDAYFQ